MPDFNKMPEVNICLLIFSVLVMVFIFIAAITDPTRKRPFMKCFICLLASGIVVQLGEAGIWFFVGRTDNVISLTICCILSYGVGSFIVVLFTYAILGFFREKENISLLPAHVMAVISCVFTVFIITSAWNGTIFTIDGQGYVKDGPYGFMVYLFDVVTFIVEIVLIIYYHRLLTVRGFLVLLGYCIVQLMTMFMVDIWYPVPMYLTATLFLVLLFVFFHGELTRQLSMKEIELKESKIAIMVSQIQPHFLYNSLNTIYHLCDKDVSLAKQAISDFSEYLHHILDTVNRTTPVRFDEELNNVKTYLSLEQMRFGEKINIVYHIETTDFFVPALSIQPLVENAVKHGLCKKDDGGTITIYTKECEDFFDVIISDDGVGFDTEKEPDDGRLHVGIKNVRQRLYSMCKGKMIIYSRPGEGTVVSVRLPKGEYDEDNSRR